MSFNLRKFFLFLFSLWTMLIKCFKFCSMLILWTFYIICIWYGFEILASCSYKLTMMRNINVPAWSLLACWKMCGHGSRVIRTTNWSNDFDDDMFLSCVVSLKKHVKHYLIDWHATIWRKCHSTFCMIMMKLQVNCSFLSNGYFGGKT